MRAIDTTIWWSVRNRPRFRASKFISPVSASVGGDQSAVFFAVDAAFFAGGMTISLSRFAAAKLLTAIGFAQTYRPAQYRRPSSRYGRG
jgi:hypothetical protein